MSMKHLIALVRQRHLLVSVYYVLTMPYSIMALLAGATFFIHEASTTAHTQPNTPQVIIPSSTTTPQCNDGGAGYSDIAGIVPATAAAAPGAGTGILPITCETGTHSVIHSLRHKSVSSTFPVAV